ncbi:polysaccharide biosynthesis/export family protein [Nitratidesulfovibrio liaohensis]|uniref:polysaccharide biosynthesis/export family protein n=1 Tax=Nitratidesulfovibrio liaohensis TaxID=2604158 RepID=UPI0028681006|nr:polysaccharide biosynthesis/export family protein [Nitratidesulfovibrio liaohensis]
MKYFAGFVAVVAVLVCASVGYSFEYVVGYGDVINVNVWGEKELSVKVTVRPDGKVTLPGVGDVDAAGQTPEQLQTKIAAKYGEIVRNPVVTVSVDTSQNNSVIVHGPGVKPGMVPLVGRTTLLQVLTRVAPEATADLDGATLSRGEDVLRTGFRDLYERGVASDDVELKPGDRVFIPFRSKWAVYVVGAVNTPKTVAHHDGMTLLEALLAAEGFTRFADRNRTEVVREHDGRPEVIVVRAGDLVDKGDLSQNVQLQAGDYVIAKKGMF